MCGIAGFVNTDGAPADSRLLHRMTDLIVHRGPDASGFYVHGEVALGHRRLSIIDLTTGGQPMSNEDQSVWIIYNGEIFNHADVRPELEAAGHRYKSHADTETVIHAYEQWGDQSVTRYRGMFAYALWDQKRKQLFCVRDRLGIKPFYYFWNGRLFGFASEIKALLEHPAIGTEFNDTLLPEYLAFGYSSGEETLFAGIRKLMPGHTLTLTCGDQSRLEIKQYWDAPCPKQFDDRPDSEWIAECRARLEEVVRMRLMSDVPLGMFLSGGVDSSAIAAIIKRQTTGPVKTFSVGYSESRFSELSEARQVAGQIGTDHHEVLVSMEDFFNALPRLVWHEDEPITWPSSVSLHFVSKLAAEQVKVVLTGEGSDELFAGYSRYRFYELNAKWMRAYRGVPTGVRDAVQNAVAESSLLSASLRRKLGHTFLGRGGDIESLYLNNFYCAFGSEEQQRLLSAKFSANPYASFLQRWNSTAQSSTLPRLLYADQKTYLIELLMKQDQMSMSCSIESRVPFLDHKFVEFAASVPPHLKLRGKHGKYIIKKAVEDLIPRDIIYRRKMGFPTPITAWLLQEESRVLCDYLRDPEGVLAGYVNMKYLNDLLDKHERGVHDATDRIWRLLNLQVWGDIFLTGRREQFWEGLMKTPAGSVQVA
ncbi:MAG TPA: asparagine synthase (glutamine-hydrolyzing) [Candidatus Eisenbacteria bacterium]|nr:asparagine synthase (glutamine-hydrolyzing) [Candidatus Eisenbacteria bacterium]